MNSAIQRMRWRLALGDGVEARYLVQHPDGRGAAMSLKYRIGTIGWYNFETLVQTLLKGVIGPGVTSFGGTKDGGRDAAFSGAAAFPSMDTQWDGHWVFQAKYADLETYGAVRARTQLLKTFQQECASILAKREHDRWPDNYVLITDVPLTAGNRQKLSELAGDAAFEGNFHALDGKEVCEFLDLFPEVRRSYPQLLGLADLELIVDRSLYVRSEAYIRQWQPCLSTFVYTEPYRQALRILAKHHFVVLDGPPEAGKSTIAAAMSVLYAADGFEVLRVRGPDDIFRGYRRNRAQLYVADDALGSIAFDPSLTDSWSRDMSGVLRTLDAKHLLVWTARTYILQEAIDESRLGDAIPGFPAAHEVVVEVGRLTLLEKAQILYNHAKQASLSAHSRALIRDRARSIARHRNFTPERIRQLVENFLPRASQAEEEGAPPTWPAIREFLDDPGIAWLQAYRKLSESERILLMAMLDFPREVARDELERAFNGRCKKLDHIGLPFVDCVRRLEHSFLRTVSDYSVEGLLDFQHPSLRDMLLVQLRDDEVARRRYLELASPSGLAGVIQGMAGSTSALESGLHDIVPRTDEELAILIKRLAQLSSAVLSVADWRRLLLAAQLLTPRTSDKAQIPPADLDLAGFRNTSPGAVLDAVLRAFASRSTFENNRRYSVLQWTILLRSFYDLAPYVVPPPRPEFLPDVLGRLDSEEPEEAIALANLAASWEPVLLRQHVPMKLLQDWDMWFRDALERLIHLGDEPATDSAEYEAEYEAGYEDYSEWL